MALFSRTAKGRGEPDADGIRVLREQDTAAVRALVAADPVAHAFVDAQLEASRTVAPSGPSHYLGRFSPAGELVAACWVGSNVVPICFDAADGEAFGHALLRQRRRYASVFGPSQAVLGIWEQLRHGRQNAFDVRTHQPLLALAGAPRVEGPGVVRRAWPTDFEQLLPACTRMFEEELGYSPLQNGEAQYRARVDWLIRSGYALVETGVGGEVLFKAELGVVTPHATQVQGVWMEPSRRGQGLAVGRMADVVGLALQAAPVVSLYVNDYNERAVRTYASVGFEQVGEFATVLF